MNVMLIKSDADILWINFHELAQWILQPPSDRDRAAQRGIKIWELFPADGARGIDTRPCLVNNDVFQGRELLGNQLGHQFFGFPAGGAVADRDRAQVMLANELFELLLGL